MIILLVGNSNLSFSDIAGRELINEISEVNLANNAQAWRDGKHPGYEPTAWDGLQQTIDVIAKKGIRVVINGGALDPKALALRVEALVSKEFSTRSISTKTFIDRPSGLARY